MWQANWIKASLEKLHSGIEIELLSIKTTGDKILDVPLAKIGGKGLFVKEIEEALLRKEADLAVHSMKDVPAELPSGLHLTAICEREDPRDALIAKIRNPKSEIRNFNDLPYGATVGTSSLRRSCQLLNKRPDIKIAQLRGNLDTRIRKLDEGQYDAVIVAAAGIIRLGMADRITETLGPEITLPAIGQGAVGIECRRDDERINNLLKPLNHYETSVCVRAERAFLKKLEGGCQVPIAGYARLIGTKDVEATLRKDPSREGRRMSKRPFAETRIGKDESTSSLVNRSPREAGHSSLVMDGLVGNLTGDIMIKGSIKGNPDEAEALGVKLAEDLLSKGAKEILEEVYNR